MGCDILVDENFRPYLLELNTNPAIDTDTTVKAQIIPKVVHSGLDVIFDIHKNPADRVLKIQNISLNPKLKDYSVLFNELTGESVLENFDCKLHL